MYTPDHFSAPDQMALYQLMRDFPLATLVTLGLDGMAADHVSLLLATDADNHDRLRGHLARANPLWREHPAQQPVLAIFHGPQAYVSPSWYPSKQQHGKGVPTWNYAVVHAHGILRVYDDAAWVRTHLTQLTAAHESLLPQPWAMADAPPDYIECLLKAIVGIEIEITRLQGKWKMSQNQSPANRAGVADALRASGHAAAAWVKP